MPAGHMDSLPLPSSLQLIPPPPPPPRVRLDEEHPSVVIVTWGDGDAEGDGDAGAGDAGAASAAAAASAPSDTVCLWGDGLLLRLTFDHDIRRHTASHPFPPSHSSQGITYTLAVLNDLGQMQEIYTGPKTSHRAVGFGTGQVRGDILCFV